MGLLSEEANNNRAALAGGDLILLINHDNILASEYRNGFAALLTLHP